MQPLTTCMKDICLVSPHPPSQLELPGFYGFTNLLCMNPCLKLHFPGYCWDQTFFICWLAMPVSHFVNLPHFILCKFSEGFVYSRFVRFLIYFSCKFFFSFMCCKNYLSVCGFSSTILCVPFSSSSSSFSCFLLSCLLLYLLLYTIHFFSPWWF